MQVLTPQWVTEPGKLGTATRAGEMQDTDQKPRMRSSRLKKIEAARWLLVQLILHKRTKKKKISKETDR